MTCALKHICDYATLADVKAINAAVTPSAHRSFVGTAASRYVPLLSYGAAYLAHEHNLNFTALSIFFAGKVIGVYAIMTYKENVGIQIDHKSIYTAFKSAQGLFRKKESRTSD